MITLRRFDKTDLSALLAIQNACAGSSPRWPREQLERQLTDPARDHGRRVVVAERGGLVVGGAGWVEAGAAMFGSPVLASDADTAAHLVDHLVARARETGADTLRIGATDADVDKINALRARGFAVVFDFLTLSRSTSPITAAPVALTRVPLEALPRAVYRDLHNETFADVPNAPPMDDAEAQHQIDRHWPEASGAWIDERGGPVGFVLAVRDRDGEREYVEDDSIGVRSWAQRRGLAVAMLAHMTSTAHAAGLAEMRALIASTNTGSLALHKRVGFTELSRRSIWELTIRVRRQ